MRQRNDSLKFPVCSTHRQTRFSEELTVTCPYIENITKLEEKWKTRINIIARPSFGWYLATINSLTGQKAKKATAKAVIK